MGAPLVIKRDLLSKTLAESLNPGVGVFIEYNIKNNWALQLEVNYQEQRKSFLLTGSERMLNLSVLEYIRLPLLIKYKIPFKSWSLSGVLGLNPGYAVELKSGSTNQNFNLIEYEILSFSENNIRRFDFSILTGIGVEKILANNLKTKLSLRYNLGIIDIMEDPQSTFYNKGYALDIGFLVPLAFFKKSKDQKVKD